MGQLIVLTYSEMPGLRAERAERASSSLFPHSYNVVPHIPLSLLPYSPSNSLDMVSNGIHKRVLKPGVWAPSPAFMDEQEEVGECRCSVKLHPTQSCLPRSLGVLECQHWRELARFHNCQVALKAFRLPCACLGSLPRCWMKVVAHLAPRRYSGCSWAARADGGHQQSTLPGPTAPTLVWDEVVREAEKELLAGWM